MNQRTIRRVLKDMGREAQAKQRGEQYSPRVGTEWQRVLCQYAYFVGPRVAEKKVRDQFPQQVEERELTRSVKALYPVLESMGGLDNPGLYMEYCV